MNLEKEQKKSKGWLVVLAIAFAAGLFILVPSKKPGINIGADLRVFTIPQGGTGTSTRPLFGQLLMGNGNGSYNLVATSSLGIVETDPVWSAFLLNPVFTNLTSTNFFATSSRVTNEVVTNATTTKLYVSGTSQFDGLMTFATANGTSLTTTNFNASLGQITQLGVNSSSPIAQLSVLGVGARNPVKVMSSTGAQLFAVNTNGQVVVGPNSLSQTGALTIETQSGNDIALSFTDGVNYTFQLGRVAGTSGQSFIGGPSGTKLNLRAGGTDRVFILSTNGFVGIGTSTPVSLLSMSSSATTTFFIDSTSGTKGSCEVRKDSDGSGYTYITYNNGVANVSTVDCR